jgi:hypothetical protein
LIVAGSVGWQEELSIVFVRFSCRFTPPHYLIFAPYCFNLLLSLVLPFISIWSNANAITTTTGTITTTTTMHLCLSISLSVSLYLSLCLYVSDIYITYSVSFLFLSSSSLSFSLSYIYIYSLSLTSLCLSRSLPPPHCISFQLLPIITNLLAFIGFWIAVTPFIFTYD